MIKISMQKRKRTFPAGIRVFRITRLFSGLAVLWLPHLATLWVGQLLSAVGDRLYEIAVIWLSVRLVGGEAGFVLAAGSLARLAFGLLGGVYADRWKRYKTMVAVDLLRATAVMTLPLITIWEEISLWHLAAVSVVVGALGALFEPTLQASLPTLTEDTRTLQAANGLMDITTRLARIVGPGLAGWLAALMPLPHFFTIDALSFAVSAMALLSLRRTLKLYPTGKTSRGIVGIFRDVAGALHLIQANRPLLWGLVSIGLINMLWSSAFTVGVALLVDRVLVTGVGGYGLVVAAYGAGNVASNIIVGSLRVAHRIRFLFAGKTIMGVGFLIIAFAPTLAVAAVGAAIAAVGGPMGDIMLLMIIQEEFPTDQIGKIFSTRTTLSSAGFSVGLLLAAPLFATLPAATGIALCSLGFIGIGVLGLIRFHR